MNSQARVEILGVPVDDVTIDEACDRAAALVTVGGAHQITTVNPEFIMLARRDPEFRQVLRGAALNVPDGAGVLWAARRMGRPLRERVAGSDLIDRLCATASRYRWRAFFLGARPGVAERAAAILALKHSGLSVAGSFAGSPRLEDEADIVSRIQRARPNVVFVAYGAPAQDKWVARNLPVLLDGERPPREPPGLVAMGVGGSFDFIAGLQRRAPSWVQAANLEWLYRLWREPWRWRRQTALARYALIVMLKSLR
jgi:N-acetylglucosaminyldiphosphoundecaprenol N-acetyl-beta-D-mannosaminyltransferase